MQQNLLDLKQKMSQNNVKIKPIKCRCNFIFKRCTMYTKTVADFCYGFDTLTKLALMRLGLQILRFDTAGRFNKW